MEHVGRLKRLVRHRPVGRPLQRCVRALEEAALKMELEARALSVRHWRAEGAVSTWRNSLRKSSIALYPNPSHPLFQRGYSFR